MTSDFASAGFYTSFVIYFDCRIFIGFIDARGKVLLQGVHGFAQVFQFLNFH